MDDSAQKTAPRPGWRDILPVLDEHRARYPRAVRVVESLATQAPMLRRAVADMISAYRADFFRRGEDRVGEIEALCGGDEKAFQESIRAYMRFCLEFSRKQAEFMRTGHYAFKDFDEMYAELYGDDSAVQGFYLPALLLSFVFSPNYYEYYDFFEAEFLPRVPGRGNVVEIGCGHGVYLGRTLLSRGGLHGVGIDISAGALKAAGTILRHYGLSEERFELSCGDLRGRLSCEGGSAAAVICCEVLEHLPDPAHALAELRRISAGDAVLMLSAAIRMESVDHLYVFRTHGEVKDLVEKAGFCIEAQRVVPLAKGRIDDPAERQRLADDPSVPVGYICRARPA